MNRAANTRIPGRPARACRCAAAAVVAGAAVLCGAVVAVDCSEALQRRVLEAAARAARAAGLEVSWQQASFALWRGRVVLRGVVCQHGQAARVQAERVCLGLRPALSVARLLRFVDISGVDALVDLRKNTSTAKTTTTTQPKEFCIGRLTVSNAKVRLRPPWASLL